MGVRVQAQHPLAERAFELGQRALEHDEAAAGEPRGRGEIHQAQGFAELEMLFCREVLARRLAMLLHHDIGGFIRTVGDFGVEDVGKGFQQLPQGRLMRGNFRL